MLIVRCGAIWHGSEDSLLTDIQCHHCEEISSNLDILRRAKDSMTMEFARLFFLKVSQKHTSCRFHRDFDSAKPADLIEVVGGVFSPYRIFVKNQQMLRSRIPSSREECLCRNGELG